jgi:hypothetical protein
VSISRAPAGSGHWPHYYHATTQYRSLHISCHRIVLLRKVSVENVLAKLAVTVVVCVAASTVCQQGTRQEVILALTSSSTIYTRNSSRGRKHAQSILAFFQLQGITILCQYT